MTSNTVENTTQYHPQATLNATPQQLARESLGIIRTVSRQIDRTIQIVTSGKP